MRPLLGERQPGYGSLATEPTKARFTDDLRTASLLSRLLFTYAEPLMAVGAQRQLDTEELWELDGENVAATAYATFKRAFVGADGRRTSIARAIVASYGLQVAVCGVGTFFTAVCALFAPLVLHHVIDALSAPAGELDTVDLIQWLAAFFASKLLNAIISTQAQFQTEMVAMRLTVSLRALLFEKVMRCTTTTSTAAQSNGEGAAASSAESTTSAAADIVNLYTTDVVNILWAAFQFNNIWVLPLQIVAVVYMLYTVLGVAAFAGLGMIALSIAASFVIALLTGKAFSQIMECKDVRLRAMKEVFGAIQVVKLNAWEPKFARKIATLRSSELRAVARYLYLGATSRSVLWGSPLFVSMSSFAVYTLVLGNSLTAAKVFTSMALFNAIRDPLQTLPTVIQQCIQAKVSLDRMEKFLKLDEVDHGNVVREDPTQPASIAIAIANGQFAWNRSTNESDASGSVHCEKSTILSGINFEINQGDLVVVDGAVGAGKSSLCSALLGDIHKLSGSVFVRGRVAYYSQQPWIQNMSLRDNILFGSEFDRVRYQRVLDACCLVPDLEQLPGGDLTEIGQKGVNLSGGQKARVCLARACYSDADVLILDSPLAAVDTVVQGEIFRKCICDLLQDKTVLLVTHITDVISSDAVNGQITVTEGRVSFERRERAVSRSMLQRLQLENGKPSQEDNVINSETHVLNSQEIDKGKLIEDEDRFEGRVSKAVFVQYLESMGGLRMCVFVVVVQGLWQAFQVSSDLWLSHWTDRKDKEAGYDRETTEYYLGVYAALGGASALMVVVRSFVVPRVGLRASRSLFDAMTDALLSAPLGFFDANPIGRIMNRFGDDIASVDFGLPVAYSGMLASLFFTATQLVTAVYMVNFLGVLILPLLYLYIKVANFYMVPSRESSRLWKVSTSPVLSYVAEAGQGVAIFRAFGPDFVARAVAENFARVDTVNKVWFVFTVTAQWFQVRMQLLGCGVIILVVSALIYLRDVLSPGLVGLSFTYALSVDAGLAVLVRWWSWVEIAMVSPERIFEYTSIAPEGVKSPLVVEPDAQWPKGGALTFEKATFRYKPNGPDILNSISFAIRDKEKVGIVGRTGAGKSSLTMALFRTNELVSGRIVIDGVDIATVPLRTLRSRLSIIPQSPVLFKGSLRGFMDPFDEFTDAELWSALDKVDMKPRIARLNRQLTHELTENGDNFSVGERQLLCMARALLTQARIVVMDEATASIDHATEKKLQEMIERDFEGATVLTIAHRLATVMKSDRILVLHDGKVVEFDTPDRLLVDPKGVFFELAKEGGY
jgi:ATP-binding cassette subfamily C (CFTR/MRP) protein 1